MRIGLSTVDRLECCRGIQSSRHLYIIYIHRVLKMFSINLVLKQFTTIYKFHRIILGRELGNTVKKDLPFVRHSYHTHTHHDAAKLAASFANVFETYNVVFSVIVTVLYQWRTRRQFFFPKPTPRSRCAKIERQSFL